MNFLILLKGVNWCGRCPEAGPGFSLPRVLVLYEKMKFPLFPGQAKGYGHRDGPSWAEETVSFKGRRQTFFQAFLRRRQGNLGLSGNFPSVPRVKVSVISAGSFNPALAAS